MAEEQGQERTEAATPKRAQEARDEGQVPRSRELNTLAVLLTASVGLYVWGGGMVRGIGGIMQHNFVLSREQIFDPGFLLRAVYEAMASALWMLAPLLGVILAVVLLTPALMGGWSFSAKAFGFKFERLDPVKGIGRVFSWRGLLELAKALVKFVLLGSVTLTLLWVLARPLLGLGAEPVEQGMQHMAGLLLLGFMVLSGALLLLAGVDVPFQLWDHARQLRMTKQEVRDEMKETDGRPEVKGHIRRMQREMAMRRMMADVPKADVVITNPTHYAVALRYDQGRMGAPRVVAKGADLIAARIRELAAEHEVPLLSAPPLARALYFNTELDQEIPAGLYLAVAQVLAYVYQIKTQGVRASARTMPDIDIPDDLRRD